MSNLLPDELIQLLPLERLHKSNSYWRFRCPVCGDSSTKEFKTRGFFVLGHTIKDSAVGCFNCGHSSSLINFTKKFGSAELKKKVLIETVKDSSVKGILSSFTNTIQKDLPLLKEHKEKYVNSVLKNEYFSPVIGSSSYEYFIKRLPDESLILKHNLVNIGHCSNINKVTGSLLHGSLDAPTLVYRDFDGNEIGYVFRLIDNKKLKYLASFKDQNKRRKDFPFLLGQVDKGLPIIITEGEFDALSVQNGVSGGSIVGFNSVIERSRLLNKNSVKIIVPDSDFSSNQQVYNVLEKIIETNLKARDIKVFLPDESFLFKDLNEAFSAVKDLLWLTQYVESHSYSPLQASIRIKSIFNDFSNLLKKVKL